MKRIAVLILIAIMIVAVGGLVQGAISELGTFKQNEDITLLQTCQSCTFNYINSIVRTSPNSSIIISNASMSRDRSLYNYTLDSDYTSTIGKYVVIGIGDVSGTNTTWEYTFEITYTGSKTSSSQAIIYFVLLIVFIFIFIITVLGIQQLPSSNMQDEEGKILSISYLKYLRPVGWFFLYFLFIAILYLSSNIAFAFLDWRLFAQTLFMLFKVCFALAPLIVVVWIIWIYRQMFHDKQMQKMLNRGMFPEGRLP